MEKYYINFVINQYYIDSLKSIGDIKRGEKVWDVDSDGFLKNFIDPFPHISLIQLTFKLLIVFFASMTALTLYHAVMPAYLKKKKKNYILGNLFKQQLSNID